MKTILELNRPVKTLKPREVTITELKAEIKDLRRIIGRLNRELSAERAHVRDTMAIMREMAIPVRMPRQDCCACTPTRADFIYGP
jgi:predicted  nucleic acid-binding Zn-ribbon protein